MEGRRRRRPLPPARATAALRTAQRPSRRAKRRGRRDVHHCRRWIQPGMLEQGRRARPPPRVAPKRVPQKVARRRAEAVRKRGCAIALRDVEQGRHLGRALGPGRLPGHHLQHRARGRPHVGRAPRARLLDDLGRHPVGRALDGLEAQVCGVGGGGAVVGLVGVRARALLPVPAPCPFFHLASRRPRCACSPRNPRA